jgi:hypothetical protein
VLVIFAGTRGYLDEVPLEDVGDYERRMLDHARVLQWQDLIGRRGPPHQRLPMQGAILVLIAAGQRQLEFGSERVLKHG